MLPAVPLSLNKTRWGLVLSYAAMSSRLLSSFSFHVEPSSKNSFFHMGTVALSSSISQWTAWGQMHRPALTQTGSECTMETGGRGLVVSL